MGEGKFVVRAGKRLYVDLDARWLLPDVQVAPGYPGALRTTELTGQKIPREML